MEKQERDIQLILGCGEKGAIWQPNEEGVILGKVDTQVILGLPHNFLLGDVLALPFQNNSVDRIYGDFILNAVEIKGLNYKEIAEDPYLIYRLKSCPQRITFWIEENFMKMQRSKRKLEQLRWSLRKAALEEMWRVLAMEGRIEIIDHQHVVDWVRNKGANFLRTTHQGLILSNRTIVIDDFERSASLCTVCDKNEPVSKIVLHKTLGQIPLFDIDAFERAINGKISLY